jgi:hypothetical protein
VREEYGIPEIFRTAAYWISIAMSLLIDTSIVNAQAPANSVNHCVRISNLEPNRTYTLAVLVSDEWNWWASAVVNFAGRVTTEDGTNTFADVWILHTDVVRWGVNEELSNARGPIFNIKERESFWGKGGAEVRVRTRDTATKVCMCTSNDANKLANDRCLKEIAAQS